MNQNRPKDNELEDLGREYRALLAVAQAAGPSDQVWSEFATVKKTMDAVRSRQEESIARAPEGQAKQGGPVGALLGAETTGLEATTALGLQPVPTGIYHVLDPATDPLLTVTVKNESH